MKPLLTVLIPTLNNFDCMVRTVVSLIRNTEFPVQINVLDNASTDESKNFISGILASTKYENCKAISMGSNKGWMGALNAGLKHVDTEFVCCLNDDVVFIPGHRKFWRELLNPFKFAEVGATGPSSNFVMGGQNIFQVDLPLIYPTTLLIGFCMVLRTSLIKEIGGWDEKLPGGDDLDVSIRVRDSGNELFVVRSAYLHHVGQQTGPKVRPGWDNLEHQEQTNNALIRKHGVRKWYECFQAKIDSNSNYMKISAGFSDESIWLKDVVPTEGHGFNLGCGDMDVGTFGLDTAKPGEHGAGGRKHTEATPSLVADALDIPVADNSLDYVVASHLFEHLLDPYEALAEWNRAMKPGGRAIVICPDHERLPTMLIDHTHVHAYTPDSFERLMNGHGWSSSDRVDFPRHGSFGGVYIKG